MFDLNKERHNYNTRHKHDMQINTGNGNLFIHFLAFMAYKYGIIYPTKIELMYHMHALRTYQNRTYKTMIYCIEYDKTLYYRLSYIYHHPTYII